MISADLHMPPSSPAADRPLRSYRFRRRVVALIAGMSRWLRVDIEARRLSEGHRPGLSVAALSPAGPCRLSAQSAVDRMRVGKMPTWWLSTPISPGTLAKR